MGVIISFESQNLERAISREVPAVLVVLMNIIFYLFERITTGIYIA